MALGYVEHVDAGILDALDKVRPVPGVFGCRLMSSRSIGSNEPSSNFCSPE
jgi:hypothetical protein